MQLFQFNTGAPKNRDLFITEFAYVQSKKIWPNSLNEIFVSFLNM